MDRTAPHDARLEIQTPGPQQQSCTSATKLHLSYLGPIASPSYKLQVPTIGGGIRTTRTSSGEALPPTRFEG
jgi:hypothetical protein